MGNSSSTIVIVQQNETPPPNQPPPPPNFMQNFITEINLVQKPTITYTGNAANDTNNLFLQLNSYVNTKFSNTFSYAYMGNNSVPPNCTDQSTVFGLSDVTSVFTNNPTLISQYISTNVIPNSTLPTDIQPKASADLVQNITVLLQSGVTNAWLSTKYHRAYTAKDKTNWVVEGSFVYAVAPAVDYTSPGSAQNMLFLQYLGTTYEIK